MSEAQCYEDTYNYSTAGGGVLFERDGCWVPGRVDEFDSGRAPDGRVRFVSRLPRSNFFDCSMLQKQVSVPQHDGTSVMRWESMSCRDPDDYESLFDIGFHEWQFEPGGMVWVLVPGLEDVPRPKEGCPPYYRIGIVGRKSSVANGGFQVQVRLEPCKAKCSRLADGEEHTVVFAGELSSGGDNKFRMRLLTRPTVLPGKRLYKDDIQDHVKVKPGRPVVLQKHFVRNSIIVPVSAVPLRVAKYNVVLKRAGLWAVRAEHEILSNMVIFRCRVCD